MTNQPQIIELGNPILRQTAEPIKNLAEPQLQTLIDYLLAAAETHNGVGIAAPQVGVSKRLLLVASRPTLRYPNAPYMPPTPMLNPRIIAHSNETAKDWEGCLSVPGIRGLVSRHREVEVEYITRNGKTKRQIFTDFVARIFQHEYDHLEGKVFLDRVESSLDLMTEHEYQKQAISSLPTR
jgi:peptide deformylase